MLDAQGDPNALFVFLIGSTLTTATSSSVVFVNSGGLPVGSVYWKVGSSATLGTTTAFARNILDLFQSKCDGPKHHPEYQRHHWVWQSHRAQCGSDYGYQYRVH